MGARRDSPAPMRTGARRPRGMKEPQSADEAFSCAAPTCSQRASLPLDMDRADDVAPGLDLVVVPAGEFVRRAHHRLKAGRSEALLHLRRCRVAEIEGGETA